MTENALGVIFSRLMEAIHIKLSNKTIHLSVPKVTREHYVLEFVDILYYELFSGSFPLNNFCILLILELWDKYIQDLKGFGDETCNLNLWVLNIFLDGHVFYSILDFNYY